jgi:hypothetical protein
MKRFFLRAFFFLIVVTLSAAPFIWKISKHFNDRFYNKFRDKANSMIIGGSRALFGINPDSLNRSGWMKAPVLNFSFTVATSPYGETYYDAIVKKIQEDDTGGVFILDVNPITISASKKNSSLPEDQLILSRLKVFNMDPNLDYILENGGHPLYQFLFDRSAALPDGEIPHTSGWLEGITKTDSIHFEARTEKGITAYRKVFGETGVSDFRLAWLRKIVDELSAHGRVYLVRLPVSLRMRSLEQEYYPDFSDRMHQLIAGTKAKYFDFSERTGYVFNDIHHLSAGSACAFSSFLADTLSKIR